MDIGRQSFIRHVVGVLSVLCYLVSIHTDHWHLDRAVKVKVVVTQVVGASNKLLLRQLGCVIGHLVNDWTGCTNGVLV